MIVFMQSCANTVYTLTQSIAILCTEVMEIPRQKLVANAQ
jgi:hypothetical protein